MKKLFTFAIALLFTSLTIAQKKPDYQKRLKGVEKPLNELLDSWKAPGFAVAVVDQDGLVYSKGFGYRDTESKKEVTPNTLFAIGSSTKAFTTSLLGILEQEGEISLEASPAAYIPGFHFYNTEMDNMISIKDMMSHRTGLPRHDLSWYLFPTPDRDSLLQRVTHQEPFAGVREQWYYNNFMYLAQGVIAEKVTGKSWEENIAEKFFKPLGMNRSVATIAPMSTDADAAAGYEVKNDSIILKMQYYDISGMSPAGSINSSVNDMAKWVQTWINGGKYGDKEIIPANFVKQAMSSQMVIAAALPEPDTEDLHFANYGFGWFMSSYKGHYRVEHGGNIDGFSANVAFFPSDSLGIIVLANQNGSRIPTLARNILADRILNEKRTDWNKKSLEDKKESEMEEVEGEEAVVENTITGTKPSHSLIEYAGKYSHPGYGTFELAMERDSLFAQFPIKRLWLKHKHYDTFNIKKVKNNKVDTTESLADQFLLTFLTNGGGDISGMQLNAEPTLDPLVFERTPNLIDVDKETLQKYVGDYVLGGITGKVFLQGEETLMLSIPGQPEYTLLPTATHKFSIKGLDGFKLEFLEDGSKINEVLFMQPNGTFKAVRK